MRLRANQLDTELQKKLMPVYLVTGDEPLLIQEALDSIRQACKQRGFDERKILEVDRKFDWQSLLEEANTLSLFSEKILTELRLGTTKPGVPGGKILQSYCKALPEDKVLLICAGKMDSKSLAAKWCSEIDRVGAIVQIWPIALHEMPQWLAQRARKMGLNIDKDAIQLLADRLEGNLLAAQQELEKLKLLYPEQLTAIDSDKILASVADSSKYDIFNLTDACLTGDAKLSAKILNSLKVEGLDCTVALWALTKDIRLLSLMATANLKGQNPKSVLEKEKVFVKRHAILLMASQRLSLSFLQSLLDQCKLVDDVVKGVHKGLDPWDILFNISFGLSGQPLPVFEI